MARAPKLHLDKFLPYRLSVLTNIVSQSIAEAYEREFGLSIPQWRVIAVRAVTSAAERPGFAARTAITRHSGIDRPKCRKYAVAIAPLTVFESTDSR